MFLWCPAIMAVISQSAGSTSKYFQVHVFQFKFAVEEQVCKEACKSTCGQCKWQLNFSWHAFQNSQLHERHTQRECAGLVSAEYTIMLTTAHGGKVPVIAVAYGSSCRKLSYRSALTVLEIRRTVKYKLVLRRLRVDTTRVSPDVSDVQLVAQHSART